MTKASKARTFRFSWSGTSELSNDLPEGLHSGRIPEKQHNLPSERAAAA